ncbi:hypothetical protein BD413DRAFT_259718 [Trametes elegans]|nr:hypothetical protein BD413DRAFT_259718 [Trametes elegans]
MLSWPAVVLRRGATRLVDVGAVARFFPQLIRSGPRPPAPPVAWFRLSSPGPLQSRAWPDRPRQRWYVAMPTYIGQGARQDLSFLSFANVQLSNDHTAQLSRHSTRYFPALEFLVGCLVTLCRLYQGRAPHSASLRSRGRKMGNAPAAAARVPCPCRSSPSNQHARSRGLATPRSAPNVPPEPRRRSRRAPERACGCVSLSSRAGRRSRLAPAHGERLESASQTTYRDPGGRPSDSYANLARGLARVQIAHAASPVRSPTTPRTAGITCGHG